MKKTGYIAIVGRPNHIKKAPDDKKSYYGNTHR